MNETALKTILAKAYEQPVPELLAIEIDRANGEVRQTVIILN